MFFIVQKNVLKIKIKIKNLKVKTYKIFHNYDKKFR